MIDWESRCKAAEAERDEAREIARSANDSLVHCGHMVEAAEQRAADAETALGVLQRSVEFNEKAYLAEHGHWGKCRFKAERDAALLRVAVLREAYIGDLAAREAVHSLLAHLSRDVAPLIAAFRDSPATVTEDEFDAALQTMGELQRVDAGFGARYFDRRDILANPDTAVQEMLARAKREAFRAGWEAGADAVIDQPSYHPIKITDAEIDAALELAEGKP